MQFDRCYELFGQIEEFGRGSLPPVCQGTPIPTGKRVEWYGDEGLKTITTDPYGKSLTYLHAEAFHRFRTANREGNILSDWNKAVLAMLKALPPTTQ
jgi:hypothetical protein